MDVYECSSYYASKGVSAKSKIIFFTKVKKMNIIEKQQYDYDEKYNEEFRKIVGDENNYIIKSGKLWRKYKMEYPHECVFQCAFYSGIIKNVRLSSFEGIHCIKIQTVNFNDITAIYPWQIPALRFLYGIEEKDENLIPFTPFLYGILVREMDYWRLEIEWDKKPKKPLYVSYEQYDYDYPLSWTHNATQVFHSPEFRCLLYRYDHPNRFYSYFLIQNPKKNGNYSLRVLEDWHSTYYSLPLALVREVEGVGIFTYNTDLCDRMNTIDDVKDVIREYLSPMSRLFLQEPWNFGNTYIEICLNGKNVRGATAMMRVGIIEESKEDKQFSVIRGMFGK